jgi:hypothetical protein
VLWTTASVNVHLRYIGRKQITLTIRVPVEARTPEQIAARYPLLVQAKMSVVIGAAHERNEAKLDAMRMRLADLVQKGTHPACCRGPASEILPPAGGFLITEEEEGA